MEGHAWTWFTPKQKAELWERWKSGQWVADVARALERRNKSGVYRVLALNGGIAPAPRRRASVALRLEEREEMRPRSDGKIVCCQRVDELLHRQRDHGLNSRCR
jgi:hypothetical protein